jgi:hypothetical protein
MGFDVAKWNKKRYYAHANIREGKSIEDQHLDIVIQYLRDASGDDAADYLEQMRSFVTNSMGKASFSAPTQEMSQPEPDVPASEKTAEELVNELVTLVDDAGYWSSSQDGLIAISSYSITENKIREIVEALSDHGLGETAKDIVITAQNMYLGR